MKENPIDQGRFSVGGHGLGTVTQQMVRERASQIAIINGRSSNDVLDSDLAEAWRELTGQERLAPHQEQVEELDESERWDPVPGSTGSPAPTIPAPDEQTFAEKLVEEGIEDAEQEQMVEGNLESKERDLEP